MVRYLGPGLLGLGITALIAGFMSGMAGNVSAFSDRVDIRHLQAADQQGGSDEHYVAVGRWAIVIGVVISIGAGLHGEHAHGIMDYVQALFSFFIAPLLGVVLIGMFWKRATAAGGISGAAAGTLSSIGLLGVGPLEPCGAGYVALSQDAKPMAENMFRALWS